MTNKIPKELTHYTTLGGLVGILESNTLWASNALFLNDKSELLHGFEAAKLAVKVDTASAERKWIKAVIDELSIIEDDGLADAFITCFCERPDVLSLWRGYGATEQGVAITFDGPTIARLLGNAGSHPSKVIYAEVTTVQKFRTELKKEIAELQEWKDDVGELELDEIKEDARKIITKLLPRFKHNGFRDEREFRFVAHGADDASVKFRTKGSVIVPYITLPVGPRLPIKFITVGPGSDVELTRKSVERYLRAKDYKNAEVRSSKVPYRA
ncbi:DUF2971 domain-containing protein [Janthinobacterium sp. BJB401]|uniref:DUF2971 domain-containing protein n=1 Tax=Janthinobacterium sp. BJB401 TaxID=2745934 RepID=UPI0015958E07|nr:DUF2971 domain-containing protein [Janthinobacterium sp. BJB401]NVI84061.1 DUF2971 domain-containing protein [Janthinobacterium sp. BJB401]